MPIASPIPEPEVLVVFPPLNPMYTYAELALPQLSAALHAVGIPTAPLDLNVLALEEWLCQEPVLAHWLAQPQMRFSGMTPGHDPGLDRRTLALWGRAFAAGLAKDKIAAAAPAIANWVHHIDGVLGLRLEPPSADAPPCAPDLLDRIRSLNPSYLAYARRARLAQLLEMAFLRPSSYEWEAVEARARQPNPFLDSFLAQYLDPRLSDGLRVLAISVHGRSQLIPALRIAVRVRELMPQLHISLGGPWCVAARSLILQSPAFFDLVDSVCTVEGEAVLEALTRSLREGRSWHGTPGILFRRAGAVIANPDPPLQSLESLPVPRYRDMPMRLYYDKRFTFRTLRGCYWGRCTFCYHIDGLTDPSGAPAMQHQMSPALLDMLEQTARGVIDEFGEFDLMLADNATPPSHMAQIADRLDQAKLRIPWRCLARFDKRLTRDFCRRIADSGCRSLSLGLETASEPELRRLRKGINLALVEEVLDNCARAGIRTAVFVLDMPGLAQESLEQSLDFTLRHRSAIDMVLVQRFELGRHTHAYEFPSSLGIELTPQTHTSFSVFDLPLHAPAWRSEADFRRIVESFAARFVAARQA